MATYEKDERSKGVRLNKRTRHEVDTVEAIVNECPILHCSFTAPIKNGPPFPTVLPMLGAIAKYDEDEEAHLYLHGSSVARLFQLTNGTEVALCVCATILDGYVMALTPFHNSCNYRSAVVFGYGQVVEDEKELVWGLHLITNNTMPQRWENSRSPPTKSELDSTALLKVRIETASAKVRNGQANDEKHDLNNPDVADNTWTGVVPTYMMLGEPVPNEQNKVKVVPEYLADWVADANSLGEQRAIDALDV